MSELQTMSSEAEEELPYCELFLQRAFKGSQASDDMLIELHEIDVVQFGPNPGEVINPAPPARKRVRLWGETPTTIPRISYMDAEGEDYLRHRRQSTDGFRPKHLLSERSEPPLWVLAEDVIRNGIQKARRLLQKIDS